MTDNLVDGDEWCTPPACDPRRRRPYLVVAADKGTATFSDTPTRSRASTTSGSATPSPPAARRGTTTRLGITARGAWESVKRHFREMGRDIHARAIHRASASATCRATCSATACCCRTHTRLVAAFDHRTSSSTPTPTRDVLRRAPPHVRAAALELGGLRREAAFRGRRVFPRAPSDRLTARKRRRSSD